MVLIEHNLRFVTELDETNPTVIRLLKLEKEMQIEMLEGALRELLVPVLKPTLEEFNAGSSWAVLKVAD
jgi:hypothetical protein